VQGFRISPLFADDLATAEALLQGLAAETDDVFYVHVSDETANPAAAQFVCRDGSSIPRRDGPRGQEGWGFTRTSFQHEPGGRLALRSQ
jgi:hypothetical protein